MVSGLLDAEGESQVSLILAERGLFPVTVAPADGDRRPAASRRDLAITFRSIAALVSAGVPLERALASTAPLAKGALRQTLDATRALLNEGRSLAQALSASRGVVPGVVIGMIRAGERGS